MDTLEKGSVVLNFEGFFLHKLESRKSPLVLFVHELESKFVKEKLLGPICLRTGMR